jgi:DNA polymerase IV
MIGYNQAKPLVMHIDLNSCFATVEQQARVRLRNRPVAVVNRRTDMTMIVTCSYEAKAAGVKLGMRLRDARKLCPGLIGVESDPPKYRYVYHKLLDIMNDYSAHVTMKSIDEGVIDFGQAPVAIVDRGLEEIGREIKHRLRTEIGKAMRCNVGIATNRFLAKTAASLDKPDGMDVITHENLREVYASMKLTEITGIAERNEKRLNAVGIMTPLQFLDATPQQLHDMVFHSINGEYWHQRLRGWEVDDVTSEVKRVGRQYVLDGFNLSFDEILQRLHHLCESVGQRMRKQGLVARGVYVGTRTFGMTGDKRRNYWHAMHVSQTPFFSDQTIYTIAKQLFVNAPPDIRDINVHCYLLERGERSQMSLFADEIARDRSVANAIDEINDRYGEHTVHSADTLKTGPFVKTKIPFGSTRYL